MSMTVDFQCRVAGSRPGHRACRTVRARSWRLIRQPGSHAPGGRWSMGQRRRGGFTCRRVLIVHASRHGGTAGIADRIGTVMRSAACRSQLWRSRGRHAGPRGLRRLPRAAPAVYMGSWVKDGHRLASTATPADPVRDAGLAVQQRSAAGIVEGVAGRRSTRSRTRSGRRRARAAAAGGRIEELAGTASIRASTRVPGRVRPRPTRPKTMPERVVRMLPAAHGASCRPATIREWPLDRAVGARDRPRPRVGIAGRCGLERREGLSRSRRRAQGDQPAGRVHDDPAERLGRWASATRPRACRRPPR